MIRIKPLYFLIVFSFSSLIEGCVLVSDNYQATQNSNTTPVQPVQKSPQEIAEGNVEAYIKSKFDQKLVYKGYNFGELFRLKKKEQQELDQLKESRDLVPQMKEHYGNKLDSVLAKYDTLIAQKNREIISKNIKPDYLINHIFTMKKENGEGSVYEAEFILNDKLEVKDLHMKLAAELDKDDFEWFFYFFQKYPLFNSGDYEKDISMSDNLYDYYNQRLAGLKSNKEDFLVTALRVTRIVHKTKKFDPNIICGFIVMKKLNEGYSCPNYKPVKFTNAEEIKVNNGSKDSLIGYKIMHKYSCQSSEKNLDTKAVYAELDPYFMPAGIIPIEPPFDQYFDK